MSTRYRCPHCRAILNPGTKIIMKIKYGRKTGLALLSPKVGNYTIILPEDLPIKEGARVHVNCPVCNDDLTSPVDRRFAEVLRDRPDGGFDYIHFHREIGKQATFVVANGEVRAYGNDAPSYLHVNFFGAGREMD